MAIIREEPRLESVTFTFDAGGNVQTVHVHRKVDWYDDVADKRVVVREVEDKDPTESAQDKVFGSFGKALKQIAER